MQVDADRIPVLVERFERLALDEQEQDIFPDPMSASMADSWRSGTPKASNASMRRSRNHSPSRRKQNGRALIPRSSATYRHMNAHGNGDKDAMTHHKVVGREEWQAARDQLLQARRSTPGWRTSWRAQRRKLPWVAIEKQYRFDADSLVT
jgi:hypothetical protein